MVSRQLSRHNDQGTNLRKTEEVYPCSSSYPLYQCWYQYDVKTEHNPTSNTCVSLSIQKTEELNPIWTLYISTQYVLTLISLVDIMGSVNYTSIMSNTMVPTSWSRYLSGHNCGNDNDLGISIKTIVWSLWLWWWSRHYDQDNNLGIEINRIIWA